MKISAFKAFIFSVLFFIPFLPFIGLRHAVYNVSSAMDDDEEALFLVAAVMGTLASIFQIVMFYDFIFL